MILDKDEIASVNTVPSPYDDAMDALSSLITKRSRADKSNNGDRFDILFDYIKVLFPHFVCLLELEY